MHLAITLLLFISLALAGLLIRKSEVPSSKKLEKQQAKLKKVTEEKRQLVKEKSSVEKKLKRRDDKIVKLEDELSSAKLEVKKLSEVLELSRALRKTPPSPTSKFRQKKSKAQPPPIPKNN